MKKHLIENINHSERKKQVSEKGAELEKWFKEFYSAGCLNFEIIQKNDKRPLSKKAHLKLFGLSDEKISELLKQGINDKEFGKLVLSGLVSREKYFSAFMEAIRRGYNLAVVCGRMENFADTAKIRYLIGIDIDVDGHLRQRFEKELKEKGDKFGEFPEDKELLKEINQRRNELLQKILERFPFLDFLIVKSGTGYHLYVILEVSEQFINWLENTKTKGNFYGIRRQNEYFLLAGSRRSENVRYEYYSGKFSILSDENLAKELVLFCANDGKVVESKFQERKEPKTIPAKAKAKVEAKSEAEANFSFAIILDEEYEWLKERLKERHYHLWKILEFGYEGESAFVGQKRDFDRSRFEQALARALFEIYYDEGKYFEYSDDEMKSNVAGFLERIPHYKVFGRKEITKVQERGEKYLERTIEKAFEYFQNKLPLSVHLRKEIENFAFSCIGKWFQTVLSDNLSDNQTYQAWHLNLVPGAGKTTGLVNHIVQLKREGKIGGETKQRVILVYATKELAEEVKRKLEKEGIRVLFLRGRDKDNCLKFGDEFRRRLAEMGGNHAFYCKFDCEFRDKCGYMKQQENVKAIRGILQQQSEYIDFGVSEIADVIITTYDYFCDWYELLLSISKIVIFDDVVPQVKTIEVEKSEVVRTYQLIKQNEERLKNLNFQVDKVLEVLENLKDEKVIEFDDEVLEELREILSYLLSFSKQDIEKIPNFHISELLKFIKRFGVVKSEDGKSFVYYKFKQFDRLFHSLWLGWTYRTDLIQLALPKSVNFRVFEKGADAIFRNAIEIEKLNVPEATFRNLKNYQAVRKVISVVEQKIDEVQKQSKNQKILVVVPSQIENEVREALGERDNISIIHYWGSETKGVNKFEDYDVVILVALPIPNVYQIRERNKFLKKLAEEKLVELIEDIATDVKEHLWQIINRLRPFQKKDKNKKVKVYFVAKFSGKNNQIGSAVKKFLFSFKEEEEEEEEENQILGLYEIGRKFYSHMKGLIPKLLFFEDKKREIELKEIGVCSSEAKGFLLGLKGRFPYFPYILSDDGTIKKEEPRDKRRYYKVCKKIQKAEKLEFKIFKILYLKIQRKGRRKYDVEMDIGRTEIWGFAKDGDLDEFRKMLYEKSGILIYAVINEDGKERILNDYWTQEKIKELELLKERFNKFNILCSIQQQSIQQQQEIQQFKTRNIKKIEEYDKVIEEGLKRRKERLEKLLEEYRSRRENEDKDLLDYPDIAIEICEIFEEIWAEHKAKKLISRLKGGGGVIYDDTS
jgi:broad-specificity NMP kinase